jgi:SNF2 family DNA or RNA helicase
MYGFKFDLTRIRRRFKKAVVFSEGDVRKNKADWNAGKIDLLLAHPQSVGHGQNIQFGGNILVWYGSTFDLEYHQQMNKRLHRPGQTRPVTIHHIIARGTYDEEILPRLQARATTQDEIMAALRASMMNLRKAA